MGFQILLNYFPHPTFLLFCFYLPTENYVFSVNMEKEIRTMCQFEDFFVHCMRDNARLASHEEISIHYRQHKEPNNALRMICGCCGGFFDRAAALAHHINDSQFRLRRSKIKHYNEYTFNPNKKLMIRKRRERNRQRKSLQRSHKRNAHLPPCSLLPHQIWTHNAALHQRT